MTEETFEDVQDTQEVEETTSQETQDVDLENNEESGIDYAAKLAALEAEKAELESKNKQLYERVKKTPKPKDSNSKPVDVDLMEFFAKGGSKEEYQQLEVIMRGTGKSFDEAKEDPLFVAYRSAVQQEEKSKKAQLGASNGSPDQDSVNVSEMTQKEHHAWAKTKIAEALKR